ncbi:MAG: disulfide bond formation protein B [Myxococcota bacterium]|nr:disulfide bond formation protein B [Myxococcota bacterium]
MSSVEQINERARIVLFAAWLLAASATLGSLFFSEVMQLSPCSLCWVQRIFMFPLAIILLVGLFPLDKSVVRYALPLALLGSAVALYHTLLQVGIIPETAAPCQQGVSCSSVSYELIGLLSIPMLSLLAFLGVSGLLWILKRSELN